MKTVDVSVAPGDRLLRACASFGLAVRRRRPPRAACSGPACAAEHALLRGQILLLTGPSGSGKSRLLAQIVREARRSRTPVVIIGAPRQSDRTLLDCLPASRSRCMSALSRAGLADAPVLARTPAELSEGEFWRFALARAMLRAESIGRSARSGRAAVVPLIVCDEWCSLLDRTTARAVSLSLARWIRSGTNARLLCATAHDDVAAWLTPDHVIRL